MAVTFSKTRKVRVFPRVKESDKDQVWWTPKDIRRIRRECMSVVRVCNSPSSPSSVSTISTASTASTVSTTDGDTSTDEDELTAKFCTRGLENFHGESLHARKKVHRDSVLLVLAEQECLQYEKRRDADRIIANKYAQYAEEHRKAAHEKGLEDAIVWKELQREEVPFGPTGKRRHSLPTRPGSKPKKKADHTISPPSIHRERIHLQKRTRRRRSSKTSPSTPKSSSPR